MNLETTCSTLSRPCASVFVALAWALMAIPSAEGSLVAVDDFEDYGAGSDLLNGNGGSGWTSAWSGLTGAVSVESGAVPGSGSGARIDAGVVRSKLLSRSFAAQTDTVYMGFLLRTDGSWDASDFVQIFLNDGGSNTSSASTGIKNITGSPIFARSGSASTSTNGPATIGDTTYQVVLRVSKSGAGNYDESRVYIDQATEGTADVSQFSDSGVSTIDQVSFRNFSLEGDDAAFIDELRIGTTYEAVVAVPEPSAVVSLLGLLVLSLLMKRRFGRR